MSFADRITRLPLPTDEARGAAAAARLPGASPRLADLLRGAAGSSPYLAGLIEREADWLAQALDRDPTAAWLAFAETEGFEALPPTDLGPALRQAKRRVALYAALADLGGVWSLDEVTGVLTDLADRMGMTSVAMRQLLHRVRVVLLECVRRRLSAESPS